MPPERSPHESQETVSMTKVIDEATKKMERPGATSN